MKKIWIIAFAVLVAVGLGSCIKSDDGPKNKDEVKKARLTIQLSGVKKVQTRATEEGANENALELVDARSIIFVADPSGTIVQAVNIDSSEAVTPGTGQELPIEVAIGSSVYVVANIPAGSDYTTVSGAATLNDVKNAVSAITTQTGYEEPTMANVDGAEVAVTTDTGSDGVETVTVTIQPLIARLEIAAMQAKADAAGNTITAFDVTGVFVGEFYPSFDYTGGSDGELVSYIDDIIEASEEDDVPTALGTIFTGWEAYMKDLESVSAAGTPLIAQEPTDEENFVWAYNVVAGSKPEFVVRLENIEYTNSAGTALELTGPRYLTVVGYDSDNDGVDDVLTGFARGEVYRVGLITTGNSNFQFDFSHLSTVPYEESVRLTVGVVVQPWNITDYSPIFNK